MWKAPNRPRHEITQSYNDGAVEIYKLKDAAAAGHKPVKSLGDRIGKFRYAEMRVGNNRYYASQQNQIRIDRVIRIPCGAEVTNQDVLQTEGGVWYRIDRVEAVKYVYPKSYDLTLMRIVQSEVDANAMV